MKKVHSRETESGVILMASTMGIFIILSIFAFYLARFAVTETMTGGYHVLDIKTRNLALTGLERGIQTFKSSRATSTLTGNFNTGNYFVSFDTLNDESGTALPYTNYVTLKSKATINDVERNVRLKLSSFPEAFCFAYYGNNSGGVTFNESSGSISGDIYHNGNVSTSIVSPGIIYNSTGSGGTQLTDPPAFPTLNTAIYENLISTAEALQDSSDITWNNQIINLSSYSNNQFFINGNVTLSNVTVNGPGYLVVNGDITIQSSTNIKKGVHILCSGNFTMTSSQIGGSVRTPGLIYVEGTTSLSSSTAYGLIIAKGISCALSATSLFGGVLNYSSSFTLNNTSTITGSLVSQYSMDIQDSNSSITKGNLPPLFGLDIGLNPFVVPGSYLEY